MNNSVIIDGVRSPIGLKNGKLIGMRADDLSAQVIKGLLKRNEGFDVRNMDDLVMGCAFPEGSQECYWQKELQFYLTYLNL